MINKNLYLVIILKSGHYLLGLDKSKYHNNKIKISFLNK